MVKIKRIPARYVPFDYRREYQSGETIIYGDLQIDYACFKKSPAERLLLKIAKDEHKQSNN